MNNPYIKTLEPVWLDTDNIQVNKGKLRELIADMKIKKANKELVFPAWDIPNVQPPMDCSLKEWIGFVCTVNAVNFAFTNFHPPYNKFTIEYPAGTLQEGAFALEASFMRAHKNKIRIFDAAMLRKVSASSIDEIFYPIDDPYSIPLLWERLMIFHEVGEVLLEKFNGSWLNLFEEGNWRALGIVDQLVRNFRSFDDCRRYKGQLLEFHKRAQLLVMEYYGRAFNSGGRFPLIKDIEDIGPICGYELPKALECFGILEYSPEMEVLIESHHIFDPGDMMEIENRLATAYVMKKLCDEVGISMAQADYYIWDMAHRILSPHMLVRTTDY